MRRPKLLSGRRVLALLGLLLLFLFLTSLMMGSESIALKNTLIILGKRIPLLKHSIVAEVPAVDEHIVMILRLPRALGAILVGMALSSSGLVFQSSLLNPMADPYMLGVSAGAAFGVALSLLFPSFPFSTSLAAFLGSAVTILVVYSAARRSGKLRSTQLILTGIALSMFLSACVSLFMALSHDRMERIVYWTMGSLAAIDMSMLSRVILPMLLALLVFFYHMRDLDLLLMGEEGALSTGSDVQKVRSRLLFAASLLTGMAVSISGIIGFVGLIIPHSMRLLVGPSHPRLLPASMLGGACFLLLSDLLARTVIAPSQLPIGVVTALLGSPYFVSLLMRRPFEGGGL